MKQVPRPSIYLITDRHAFHGAPATGSETRWQRQLSAIRLAALAGCQFIQIRERDLSARQLTDFVCAAIALARPCGAKVLVNDRLDVALASGADGVHLRGNSLPVAEVRRQTKLHRRSDMLIAASTHSLAEAEAAARAGADFLVCGPVFDTLSKQKYGAPLGLERFAEICRAIQVPVFALGGINLANFREPLRHGAAGIAAIGLFTKPECLPSTIKTIFNQPQL
jgi:thiamine-phosphate pyrophosphorylase